MKPMEHPEKISLVNDNKRTNKLCLFTNLSVLCFNSVITVFWKIFIYTLTIRPSLRGFAEGCLSSARA